MEEDIKILKDVLHDRDSLSERDFKAIENILNRLEQPEKENKELTILSKALTEDNKGLFKEMGKLKTNSIPKSVIREKIEELEKVVEISKQTLNKKHIKKWQCFNLGCEMGSVNILKELLEE
jgi:hypothetical protein